MFALPVVYHHFELTCPERLIPYVVFSPSMASPLLCTLPSIRFSLLATYLIRNQRVPSICLENLPEPISTGEFYLPEGLYVDSNHCIQGSPTHAGEMTEYVSTVRYGNHTVSFSISLGVYEEVEEITEVKFKLNGEIVPDVIYLDFGQHFTIEPVTNSSCGFIVHPLSSLPSFVSFDGIHFSGVATSQWNDTYESSICS